MKNRVEVVSDTKTKATELKKLKEGEQDGANAQSKADAQEALTAAEKRYEDFKSDGNGATLTTELKALQKKQHDEEYRQRELDENITKMDAFEEQEQQIKVLH